MRQAKRLWVVMVSGIVGSRWVLFGGAGSWGGFPGVQPTALHVVSVLIRRDRVVVSEVWSACRWFWRVMVRRRWSDATVYLA